jgi:ribosome-interacting GTPase 1
MNSCDIAIRQPDATMDDVIDVIEGNRVYIPVIYASLSLCLPVFTANTPLGLE